MISVSSSNLAKVGYENGVLMIEFHSSGLYYYYDVPSYVYNKLISASSKGKFFHREIRNCYRYSKIV